MTGVTPAAAAPERSSRPSAGVRRIASSGFDRARAALSEDTKRSVIMGVHRLRSPTARWRMLPDLVILGAMRGGTTSLYNYLCMHPRVRRPLHKEVEYLTTHYQLGEGWYRAHYGLGIPGRASTAVEASPAYLFDDRIPERAKQVIPAARFVVLLRNPADRAFSHYKLMVTKGYETLSFRDALAAEAFRVAGETERMASQPSYVSWAFRRYSYVGLGMYADQLAAWFEHFPRSQFYIARSEDFFRAPGEVYLDILRFAGLQEWLPAEFRTYTYAISPAVSEVYDSDIRQELLQRFAEPNESLYALVGTNFAWD